MKLKRIVFGRGRRAKSNGRLQLKLFDSAPEERDATGDSSLGSPQQQNGAGLDFQEPAEYGLPTLPAPSDGEESQAGDSNQEGQSPGSLAPDASGQEVGGATPGASTREAGRGDDVGEPEGPLAFVRLLARIIMRSGQTPPEQMEGGDK